MPAFPPDVLGAIPLAIPRAALVTGGARRLGRAITLGLAHAGFAVAVHARRDDADAQDTIERCEGAGARAVLLLADLAAEKEMHTLVPEASAALGPIGVLINNASPFERDEWDSVTRESWDAHLEPGLRAPFVLTQSLARLLPVGAQGAVVNIIDQRVWSLTPHFVSYTLAKSGLWTLTRTLAQALAPRVRVNAVGPGPTLPSPRQSAAQFARQLDGLPLRRGASPDEIARAVLALLALPSVTGQMIALDGGQHMNWHPAPDDIQGPEE